MAEKSMTRRAAQRKAPANDETAVHDAEGAILGPLNDGDAHMLLPGDKDPAGADKAWPATGGAVGGTGGGVGGRVSDGVGGGVSDGVGGAGGGVDDTLNEQAAGRSARSGVGGGAAAAKAMSSDLDDEIASLTQEVPDDERTVAAAASSITEK